MMIDSVERGGRLGAAALLWLGIAALAAGCGPATTGGGAASPLPRVEARPAANDRLQQAIMQGDQYRQSGLPVKAAQEYEKALALDPDNKDAYARLGYALVEADSLEKAVKIYQRYVALAPKECDSHSSLGYAYLKQGLMDQAIASYESALELCPDDPNSYTNLGKVYREGGYSIEAIEAFRRSVELNPNDILGYDSLAKLYSERRLYPEAIRMYEAILANPNHGMDERWVTWAHGRLAAMYKWADAYGQAIPHYRAVMESPVSDEAARTRAIKGLAVSYEETSQMALAIELYESLIRQVPNEPGYYYRLGELMNEVGRFDDAIETVKSGQKVDGECSAHAHYVVGESYEKLGGIANYQRAEREFKRAVACGGDPQLVDRARQQIERQRQLVNIEELKRQKEQQGY